MFKKKGKYILFKVKYAILNCSYYIIILIIIACNREIYIIHNTIKLEDH